jgi:hypothetical protein
VITIDPPFYQIRGTTILRDHENPDHFYYLPGLPRIAAGVPFQLFKYRHDVTDNPVLDPTRARGAGMAQLEVEIPAPKLAGLQADLASRSGRPDAVLSPLMFRSSQVHAIVAQSPSDRLIEDLVETHTAPLVEPHHAAFMLALTAGGATLMEQAALGGQLPVGVAYEMRFLALTPSLHARVTMDYDRMYDHFSASVGFSYYVSVKLDLDLAWLVEHDLIKIDITSFTDQADRQRQEKLVMNLIAMRVQQDFFRSGMPPAPQEGVAGPLAQMLAGLSGSGSNITSASAFFVLKAKMEVVREHKTFELLYNGRTAVELTHVCCGFLATMLQDGAAPVVREVDLDDPFFSTLKVQVLSTIDFTEMADLHTALVHISHAGHRESYTFAKDTPGPYRFEVALTDPKQDLYTWEAEFAFDTDLGTGDPRVSSMPVPSRRRALLLDPLAHFRYRRVHVLLGPIDLALVPRLRVHLRVRDDDNVSLARTEIRLDASHTEDLWRVHLPTASSSLQVLARVDWEDPQGVSHEGAEEEVTGVSFVAIGPYREILAIAVQPAADWTAVTQMHVELEYRDGEHVVTRQLLFTAAQPGSQTVQIPLLDRTKRSYQWRHTLVHPDGTTEEPDWVTTDRTLLVVGKGRETSREVRVVWVGPPGGALGVRVDFWIPTATGDESTVATFLRAGQDTERVALPLDPDGQLRYRYAITRITAQGEERLRTGESQSDLLVVQA